MNPTFDKIRDPKNQIQSSQKIVLDIDKDGSYDYENEMGFQFDKAYFKKAIEEEVINVKRHRKY
jgi:hypothetical protein